MHVYAIDSFSMNNDLVYIWCYQSFSSSSSSSSSLLLFSSRWTQCNVQLYFAFCRFMFFNWIRQVSVISSICPLDYSSIHTLHNVPSIERSKFTRMSSAASFIALSLVGFQRCQWHERTMRDDERRNTEEENVPLLKHAFRQRWRHIECVLTWMIKWKDEGRWRRRRLHCIGSAFRAQCHSWCDMCHAKKKKKTTKPSRKSIVSVSFLFHSHRILFNTRLLAWRWFMECARQIWSVPCSSLDSFWSYRTLP